MKIPVAWLREYVEVPTDEAGLLAFADALTMAGLEVEEILPGPTFYTKITPNRGDWASVYGTAREAAAALKLPLKPLLSPPDMSVEAAPQIANVSVEDSIGCPRYAAKIIQGVTIKPSPFWMQERLTQAGMRPLNNVVDITNYVMLEYGQPLHAFDLDLLPQSTVIVRRAQEGETITTLDGTERKLSRETLCICDPEKPIAIAGIMGGSETEVSDSTVNIFLESAHFDPFVIRRTAKRLPLATEASYRFERFVDPALVPIAAERAAQLMAEVAGGTVVPGMIDIYAKQPPRRIMARVDRIRKLLGVDVDRDTLIAGLERLGLSIERTMGSLDCIIPSWRPDLTIEDDIAEEVGRIALGYENLPETLPPLRTAGGRDSERGLFTARVREMLVRAGLQETLSHSLTAPSPIASADEAAHRVLIRSALSPELSSLRTSLLPNLLAVCGRAFASGLRDIALFEVGQVYRKQGGKYEEPLRIAGLLSGSSLAPSWEVKADLLPIDFYYAKGFVETLLRSLHLQEIAFAPVENPILHPGRTAQVMVGDSVIGIVGEVSELTVENHDLPRRTYLFDLDGDILRRLSSQTAVRFSPLPRYPAVTRDLAPLFDTAVPFAQIEKAATEAAGSLLESLRLTDVYKGANLGAGKQAITLRMTFRSRTGTLTDTDVEAALTQVRATLVETGAEFRA